MTPHIKAEKKEVAKVVLMPGDPLRAKYIADNFLNNVKQINKIRNMFMYTGTYKNVKITVAGSGMGCPSIGIYSYELFNFYDVDTIIRIGTAGSYSKDIDVMELINVKASYSESTYAKVACNINDKIINSSENIYELFNKTSKKMKLKLNSGIIHSSDVFYHKNKNFYLKIVKKYNAIAVEMESFALFANAIIANKNAACLLTISDSLITGKTISSKIRESKLNDMIKLVLESSIEIYNKKID